MSTKYREFGVSFVFRQIFESLGTGYRVVLSALLKTKRPQESSWPSY